MNKLQNPADNSVYMPLLRNSTYTRSVVRKAERQDSEEENELMINTFLNPAPRTPIVHGVLKRRKYKLEN